MTKVFAIVVTYNGYKWLDKCFLSLIASNLPVNIIVVDNHSADHTVERIREIAPEAEIIENYQNLGFGQANNMGIKIAMDRGAEYIFLLNQDVWIEPDTIQKLVETAKLNIEYGIVSPIHLTADNNNLEDSFSGFIIPPYSSSEFLNDLYFDRLTNIYQTRFINAAAWLLSKECVETVGGFDPLFFHYEEDMNYSQRVHYHGFKIGFCPFVRICHDSANRLIEKQHLDRMYTNRLISDFLNINDRNAINKYNKLIYSSLYKLFCSLILLKFPDVKEKYFLIKFLLRNGKSVRMSRKTNMNRGMHYLTIRK